MSGAAFEVEQDGQAATPLVSRTKAAASSSSTDTSVCTRYSHPLVIPSDQAFKALLIVPLVVWWVAVLAGAWVYEGLPKGQKVYHVMMWFDKGLLRPAGALVPFAVVLLRALVHLVAHTVGRGAAPAATGKGCKQQQQPGLRLGSLLLHCLTVYAAMAAARLAIYLTHYFLLSQR